MGRGVWLGAGIVWLAIGAIALSSTWVQFRSCSVVSIGMAGAYGSQVQSACHQAVIIHWIAAAACVLGAFLVLGGLIARPRA